MSHYNRWYLDFHPAHYRWSWELPQVLVRIERPRGVWANRRMNMHPRPTFKRTIKGRQRSAEREFVIHATTT